MKVYRRNSSAEHDDNCIVTCQLDLIDKNGVSSIEQMDKSCKDLCVNGIKPKSTKVGYRAWPKDRDQRLDSWKIAALRNFLDHRGEEDITPEKLVDNVLSKLSQVKLTSQDPNTDGYVVMVYDASKSRNKKIAEVFSFDVSKKERTLIRREDIVKWGSTTTGFHFIAVRVDKRFSRKCNGTLNRNTINTMMNAGLSARGRKKDVIYAALLPQGLNELGMLVQLDIAIQSRIDPKNFVTKHSLSVEGKRCFHTWTDERSWTSYILAVPYPGKPARMSLFEGALALFNNTRRSRKKNPNDQLAQYFYDKMDGHIQFEQRQLVVMVQEFSRMNLDGKDLVFSKAEDGGYIWSDRGSHSIYYDPNYWDVFMHVYNFAGRTIAIIYSAPFAYMPKCQMYNQAPVKGSLLNPFIAEQIGKRKRSRKSNEVDSSKLARKILEYDAFIGLTTKMMVVTKGYDAVFKTDVDHDCTYSKEFKKSGNWMVFYYGVTSYNETHWDQFYSSTIKPDDPNPKSAKPEGSNETDGSNKRSRPRIRPVKRKPRVPASFKPWRVTNLEREIRELIRELEKDASSSFEDDDFGSSRSGNSTINASLEAQIQEELAKIEEPLGVYDI